MWTRGIFVCFAFCALFWSTNCQNIQIQQNGLTFSISRLTSTSNSLQLTLTEGTTTKLKAEIGVGLVTTLAACENLDNCLQIGTNIRLHVNTHIENGFTVYWITNDLKTEFKDCFELSNYNWFGGPERFEQAWPLEKLNLSDFANVVHEDQWGAVIEPYWLNSAGAYIFVDERVPLFINQNTGETKGKVCFSAKAADPYPTRDKVVLHYTVAAAKDAREAHLHAVEHFLGKPTGHPNYRILERPIWSTWARYKRDIDDQLLLKFAQEIADNGYSYGQFEIDDDWEECYGALTFNKTKFANIGETVEQIKQHNFTVTLWAHPFVNTNCEKYIKIGAKYGYFVKNTKGSYLTKWWNSKENEAAYLDFTKPEVREWFSSRLRALQENHGIDSFKFDAGESSWSPQIPVLNGDPDIRPNNIVVDYVKTCAAFGDLVEVRTGWRTQELPVFVRMIDKDSAWDLKNGLYTLITTLFQMNLNGYTMVLPDMVGGNGYFGAPSAELFVRWLQANTFMPSIQFSYVPWDYKNFTTFNVIEISKKFVELHQKYAPYIQKQMQKSIEKGHPVNVPIWWVDPSNPLALKEDTEYMLGEDILVAPVIVNGARSRAIYLPIGTWIDGNNGTVYQGPLPISKYDAPIDILPYFIRQGSEADLGSKDGGANVMSVSMGIILAVVLKSIDTIF